MNYQSAPSRPNHEAGAWQHARVRWREEAPDEVADFHWDWFSGEEKLGMDPRLFIPVNTNFIPPFEHKVIEETERYIVQRNTAGVTTRALKEDTVDGQRACMDEYIGFPVKEPADFADIKCRMGLHLDKRHIWPEPKLRKYCENSNAPVICGRNCDIRGFYWRARTFMGTEALSYAWYDCPGLMHEMMEFIGDFLTELCRPIVETVCVDYVTINEDLSMKGGPLLGPHTYKEFIFPHMKRFVDMLRSNGVKHICVDTDGDPRALIPLMMDAGVDALWPLERACDSDPLEYRKTYGRSLRLWGAVDKRELAKDRDAIRAHLATMIPLIEEGGFIPTVDHTVPPDVSWDNFRYYWDLKRALLDGEFNRLR